jgi:hypothetical protein
MTSSAGTRTLSSVLGGNRELALFEAFALRPGAALTAVEASRFSKVAWATAHRRINEWEARGILEVVGKTGKAPQYVLNLGSPSIRVLARAVNVAVRELLDADLTDESVEMGFQNAPEILVEIRDVAMEHLTWDTPSYFGVADDEATESYSRSA